MFELNGKKALVTGATGGIGKAISIALVQAGATVVATGRRTDTLQELVKQMPEGKIKPISCDLSDHQAATNLIQNAEEKIGEPLDIVVCNAGVTADQLVLRMSDDDWHKVISLNLTTTFILNKAAVKSMIKQRYGRIINITSVIGCIGNKGQANYAASKAGIIGMSKSIAQEVATRNITVNCIAPGFIVSPMTDIMTPEQKDAIKTRIPTAKLGQPEDIASAAVFLASSESHYITGHTLHVNGGMFMD